MSLQWTLVAVFLYAEVAVVVLLMLPFISASLWQKIFKSGFLKRLGQYSNFYFMAFIVVLLLLFLDSIRQMQKYSGDDQDLDGHGHLDLALQRAMKVFRAQRNCYISGFALFLAPVIYRLGSLLSKQATLAASNEASLKQAKSASDAARALMKEKEKWQRQSNSEQLEENDRIDSEIKINELKNKLQELERELLETRSNLKTEADTLQRKMEAMKTQAEGTSKEYDRLLEEHGKLQRSIAASGGDKKGD